MPLPQPPSSDGDAAQPLQQRQPLPPPDRRIRERISDGATACYRHPNRTGGRQCTRCGRHACAECLSQASVGSHCVECNKAARPDLKTRARYWQASKPTIVAYALIAINVAAFVILGLTSDLGRMLSGASTDAHLRFALDDFFVSGRNIRYDLTSGTVFSSGNEWYRLVTSGFLHFGLLHLGFNMYFLYVLGNQMEPLLGRGKFLAIYVASLLGGSAGVLVLDQGGLTAGASGAVFGLLGAFAAGLWQNGVNPFGTQIGTLLLINLGLTFFIGGISIGGHLGGLAAGAVCGFVTMAPGHKGYPQWSRWAAPAAVACAALVISVLVVR